jgi:hypothetical protein
MAAKAIDFNRRLLKLHEVGLRKHVMCAGGVSGALSRITGALGKGIATLSFDQEYQRKRGEQQAQPVDLKEGLARGGKGLVMVSHFLISS